ncbi:hypothetical protein [Desulfocurvibacter africanus]|uniref:Uncharacterized protein n=1 Tax=Desulfocurvibacter africanus subsp. africanus str. Walvis Bay TaxID=690850 RepID=F3YY25_DESAF|nr:hypothetical protein [Desulfocurvibacter africanus]EGJ51801.1 hypothetical protein Desaf_3518 [Desulfocurvibacter africanus subsp. africanus str. Walvis Bay]
MAENSNLDKESKDLAGFRQEASKLAETMKKTAKASYDWGDTLKRVTGYAEKGAKIGGNLGPAGKLAGAGFGGWTGAVTDLYASPWGKLANQGRISSWDAAGYYFDRDKGAAYLEQMNSSDAVLAEQEKRIKKQMARTVYDEPAYHEGLMETYAARGNLVGADSWLLKDLEMAKRGLTATQAVPEVPEAQSSGGRVNLPNSFDLGMGETDALFEQANQELEVWQQIADDKVMVEEEANARKAELRQQDQDNAKKATESQRQLTDEQLSAIGSTFGQMAGNMKDVSQAFGKHNKEAFALYKAFAISETIISTYESAQKAFTSMSSIPYVGTALGAAAAAAAIAGGMARVQMIRSQEPGGYALGGVSHSPQLAWVSEGPYSHEAHVPLPDGQNIPVRLMGQRKADEPRQTVHNHTYTIQAVDARSFSDLVRRNPAAISEAVQRGVSRGDRGLLSAVGG